MLNFKVPEGTEMDTLVEQATSYPDYKCFLDGKIAEDEYLKVACFRSEEGLTMALYQQL